MRCQHKVHCNLPIVYHNAWPESKFGKSVIIRRGKPDNTNWFIAYGTQGLSHCLLWKRGALGFSVLRFWLFLNRFFGFWGKKLPFFGFGVHGGLRIFHYLALGFRFSRRMLTAFRIWYPMRVLVFLVWPLWVPNSLWSERQLRTSTDLE